MPTCRPCRAKNLKIGLIPARCAARNAAGNKHCHIAYITGVFVSAYRTVCQFVGVLRSKTNISYTVILFYGRGSAYLGQFLLRCLSCS